MIANDIGLAVFVAVISLAAILRLYRIRRTKLNLAMEVALYGSQTMCPTCGSITAREKAYCLHCGKRVRDP
jgi:ribosomal protein S27AE